MSRVIQVEYQTYVTVWVDIDEDEIVKVVRDEEVVPTGTLLFDGMDLKAYRRTGPPFTEAEQERARDIADNQEWPAWEQG